MVNAAFWKGRPVFVTGHTGFMGGWLSLWLQELGARVCGYSLVPNTSPSLFKAVGLETSVETTFADIRDADKLSRAIDAANPEVVFHLAAQPLVRRAFFEPGETYAVNVLGTVNLLEAVRRRHGVRAVVVVTSDKVYENLEHNRPFREGDPLGGREPYGTSKACCEIVVEAYRRSFFADVGVGISSVRAGNIIGGGDWAEDRLVPDAVRAALGGKPLMVRNPASVRPWQHVLDAVAGLLMSAQRAALDPAGGSRPWNIGPDASDSWPVSRLAGRFCELWGSGQTWTGGEAGLSKPYEARLLTLDSSEAHLSLPWRPRIELDRALALSVEWYQAHARNENIAALSRAHINAQQALQLTTHSR